MRSRLSLLSLNPMYSHLNPGAWSVMSRIHHPNRMIVQKSVWIHLPDWMIGQTYALLAGGNR